MNQCGIYCAICISYLVLVSFVNKMCKGILGFPFQAFYFTHLSDRINGLYTFRNIHFTYVHVKRYVCICCFIFQVVKLFQVLNASDINFLFLMYSFFLQIYFVIRQLNTVYRKKYSNIFISRLLRYLCISNAKCFIIYNLIIC